MGTLENLITARDRYAAELANRQGPQDVRWDEYEKWLVSQIAELNEQIRQLGDDIGTISAPGWQISQAAT